MVKISLKQLVYLAESKTNGSLFIALIKVIFISGWGCLFTCAPAVSQLIKKNKHKTQKIVS